MRSILQLRDKEGARIISGILLYGRWDDRMRTCISSIVRFELREKLRWPLAIAIEIGD